ncbi:spore germination protein [Alteribacter natronophilus]|uniref:spore germination protein n=1 Tax=Alteribacter natronophilus TaxID=2583810 RepID=UPI00110DC6BE|nr:spore germination protein [Alteribacter natronophilus]TMW72772.1 spore germination protein [Alteribacter natronophilus]
MKKSLQPKLPAERSQASLITKLCEDHADFKTAVHGEYTVYYFRTLIMNERLQESLAHTPHQIYYEPYDSETVKEKLLKGFCAVVGKDGRLGMLNVSSNPMRDPTPPESEGTIVGPQLALNENLDHSVGLIRQALRTTDLRVIQHKIGTIKRRVRIVYLESKVNKEHLAQISQKIAGTGDQVEYLYDTMLLNELITGHPYSVFPQLLETERLDRICSYLVGGKIAILSDGNPNALIGPHTFHEAFQSAEDYYINWLSGTFIRLLRYAGFIIGLFITASYVAVMSYHYLIIPADLMVIIAGSRARVPFSPLLEALLLEFAVEVLREAGSRLPTRVGQTVGIVGGIVIGQAAVLAGLTSNILIIIVSLSMLATLLIPSFPLSNTVRVLRFTLILAAGFIGGLGLAVGAVLLLIYLARLESFGVPYLSPFGPLRPADLKDSLIRAPFRYNRDKPTSSES